MEYSDRYISEFVKDLDPFSILVIYGKRLYKVRCPYKVRVLVDVARLKEGEEVWVEKVGLTRDLRMIYVIRSEGYYFHLFKILPFNI